LAPGRAAGGVFNLTASGDKGGEATLGKNLIPGKAAGGVNSYKKSTINASNEEKMKNNHAIIFIMASLFPI